MTKAPHPTHASAKTPADPSTAQNPSNTNGKAPLWAFVVGAALLVALADTRAAPLAVAVASAAVLFQLLRF